MTLAMIRTLPAGALLLIATRSWRPAIPFYRLLVLSLLNITGFQSLLFLAARLLPGGIAALAGSLQPILLMFLVWWLDRRRPRPLAIAAALLGIAGVGMVMLSHHAAYDPAGLLAGFAATLCMAVGTYLSVRWRETSAPIPLIGWQLLLGGLVLLMPALIFEDQPARWSPAQWVGFGYLVLFATAAAYALWFRGLALLPPVAVSALGLLSPVTALLLGWCFLGQSLGIHQLFGVAAVLASVAVLQTTAGRPTR
jgi:probable blue pigment (indigoidine) exporter